MSKTVLITGCSMSIGQDLAVCLSQAVYAVAATSDEQDQQRKVSSSNLN